MEYADSKMQKGSIALFMEIDDETDHSQQQQRKDPGI